MNNSTEKLTVLQFTTLTLLISASRKHLPKFTLTCVPSPLPGGHFQLKANVLKSHIHFKSCQSLYF